MPTQAEKEQVAAILDRISDLNNPTPLDPEHLQRFRVLCLDEAKRLMAFLGQRLSKEVRSHIEHRALCFASFAFQSSVTLGEARSLSPLFRRTLTQLKNLE